jgi:hypothetical protein
MPRNYILIDIQSADFIERICDNPSLLDDPDERAGINTMLGKLRTTLAVNQPTEYPKALDDDAVDSAWDESEVSCDLSTFTSIVRSMESRLLEPLVPFVPPAPPLLKA